MTRIIYSIRICLISFFLALITSSVFSQQFTILDVDASRFPTLSARLIAIDTSLNLASFTAKDITVRENGMKAQLLGISSASRTPDSTQSIVVAIDIATSMRLQSGRLPFLKKFIQSIEDNLPNPNNEFAIVVFDNEPILAQSMTTNRKAIRSALDSVIPLRGTSFQPLFTHPKNGVFTLLEKSKKKKSVIIITDGYTNENLDDIRTEIVRRGITVHTVMIGQPNLPQLRQLSEASRGASLDILEADQSAERIAASLGNYMRGFSPLTVTWSAISLCSPAQRADIEITPLLTTHGVRLSVPSERKAALIPLTDDVSFGAVAAGVKATSVIQIRSSGAPITIDSIRFNGSQIFAANTSFPVVIPPDKPLNLELTCTPSDSSLSLATLTLYSSHCKNEVINLSCGFPGIPPRKQVLRVVQPNGGEILTTNNMYTVRWDGMPAIHYSRVELSIDNGKTWQQLADNIQGNSYQWQIKGSSSKECLIRVRHKYSNNDEATRFMQTDISDAVFTLQATNGLLREVFMKEAIIGEQKDSTLAQYISQVAGVKPLEVLSARIDGEHADDFTVVSQAPPFTIAGGSSHGIEFGFRPLQEGMREARVVLETNFGFFIHRLYGFGVRRGVTTASIDVGKVLIGDSIEYASSMAIRNNSSEDVSIHQSQQLGPDIMQFQLLDGKPPFALPRGTQRSMTFLFKPTTEGRTTARIGLTDTLTNQQYIVTLTGEGISERAIADPTSFRGIAAPTALAPKAGRFIVGTINGLGWLAGYSPTDNLMILAGGALPIPFNNQVSSAFSLGAKYNVALTEKLTLAGGYQFAKSIYDKDATAQRESDITMHIPYSIVTYGDEDGRVSLAGGYVIKKHVTIDQPEGFTANVAVLTLSGDYRIGHSWKLCGETYIFQELGIVPLLATARYMGSSYALDFGLAFLGIETISGKAPAFPLLPIVSAIWRF